MWRIAKVSSLEPFLRWCNNLRAHDNKIFITEQVSAVFRERLSWCHVEFPDFYFHRPLLFSSFLHGRHFQDLVQSQHFMCQLQCFEMYGASPAQTRSRSWPLSALQTKDLQNPFPHANCCHAENSSCCCCCCHHIADATAAMLWFWSFVCPRIAQNCPCRGAEECHGHQGSDGANHDHFCMFAALPTNNARVPCNRLPQRNSTAEEQQTASSTSWRMSKPSPLKIDE